MESEWLQQLLNWVEAHPQATGWLIFIIAWGESLLLVGILLPGAAILVALGTLVGLGALDFKLAWIAATLGAFAGDGLSFWIGHHYKLRLLKMWPMNKFPKQVEQGQTFFTKWGTLSVFIGRFVGLVRPIIPAIAGAMGMDEKKYIIISIVASILWAPFYLLPGVLFGSAMGSMTQVAGKMALLVTLIIALIIVIYWFINFIYKLWIPRAHRFLSRNLIWTQKHPKLGRFTSGLIDPRKPEKGSLALMAVSILVLTIAAIVFLLNSNSVLIWSNGLEQFVQAFNTDWTRPFLFVFLALSHDFSIAMASIAVFVWLIYRRRHVAAWHWLFVVLSSYVLAINIEIFSNTNFQINHGFHHLAWFTSVTTFWAALISGALPHKLRSWPYSLTSVLICLVGFAQIFFGQMPLGVVLISIFSAVLWAAVVAVAYRMRNRRQFLGWHISILYYSGMLISALLVLLFFRGNMLSSNSIEYQFINHNQWQDLNEDVRKDWLGRTRQSFDIRFRGDIRRLEKFFSSKQWTNESINAWPSIWQALKADSNSEKIPMIPKMDNGRIESVIMSVLRKENSISLRLWEEDMQINEPPKNIYHGYLASYSKASSWGLHYWKFEETLTLDKDIIIELQQLGFVVSKVGQTVYIEAL